MAVSHMHTIKLGGAEFLAAYVVLAVPCKSVRRKPETGS